MAKALTTDQIRERFVAFFVERGHQHVASSPIVPADDPTLLFTSAGMVQFKPLYTAIGKLPYRRATTVQKCFRATDLEQVGHTPRHLTFFEMLGNFSFGDYFKREAILWAWEFVTDVLEMDPKGIWISIYLEDDEAGTIWTEDAGVPKERIVRLGKKDNFWGPAGATGACGPSSEIYMDLGAELGCGRAECKPGCDCDRFQEFWNLVFPQFDMDETGVMHNLPSPGIDTGMGLERLAQLLQGARSVFETDEFLPLRSAVAALVGIDPGSAEHRVSFNIIADHARALTMLFNEGVYPSNERRGYVARRILRRAARRGLAMGLREPFLHRLTATVVEVLGKTYPEIREHHDRIALVCRTEETKFLETLEQGMRRFEDVVERLRASGSRTIPGKDVFLLYDTYGFPTDMTAEMATERGLEVDLEGFQVEMDKQVARARSAARFDQDAGEDVPWSWTGSSDEPHSRFVGYDLLETPVQVVARRPRGDFWEFLLDTTPFYAEGGGQVGDRGWLEGDGGFRMEVVNAVRKGDLHVHIGKIMNGGAFEGIAYRARVDREARLETERNHTGTHLLHAALKRVVGKHVTQAGSLVAPDRLRFDFHHFAPLTPEEIRAIEDDVNRAALADLPVTKLVTSMTEAKSAGAVAMFGEKYGDSVRQVFVREGDADVTRELCGGCHLRRTGELGAFRIVSEESVAAGVRRLEAVTGWRALRSIREESELLDRVESLVRAGTAAELEPRVRSVLEENERLKKELARARGALLDQTSGDVLDRVVQIDGVSFLAVELPADDLKTLRDAADKLRDRMKSGVGLLGARTGDKAALLAFVTQDVLKAKGIRADVLVKEVAEVVGGGGGGRPDLATAGGRDPEKIGEALRLGRTVLERMLVSHQSPGGSPSKP